MRSRTTTLIAATMLILALLLWGVYGYLVILLQEKRMLFAAEAVDSAQNEGRTHASQRLHTLVRDSSAEQEVLETLARTDVLTAAEAIEAAGKAARARVTVRGASATSLNGTGKNQAVKDLRAIELLVDAEGTLQSLMKFTMLVEALPFLSSVKSLELEEQQAGPEGKKASDAWRAVARIRIITTSPVGI